MAELSEAQLSSRKRWADALLSGFYIQGRGGLRNIAENSFCCLEVACDLVAPTAWEYPIDKFRPRFVMDGVECVHLPPSSVLAEFGLSDMDADDLAEWNDKGGSFAEIAAAILMEDEVLADPE